MHRPVVIAAGGTGGHFFPAEALAAELVRRGQRVALVTDARSATLNAEALAGRERFVVRGAGIAGRGMLRGAQAAAALAMGTVQARGVLAGLHAGVLVGFGGYPSVAPVLGARLMLGGRPRIVLHEQNAVLGRANRALARFADILALSHARTSRVPRDVATRVVGNPVRARIAAIAGAPYQPPETEIRLLVLGGSLGARVFSDVVPGALAALPEAVRARLRVSQQCRAEDLARARAAYAAAAIDADLAPFFTDVAALLAGAHLVIARAGASTVAELAAVGRPAILVPLPSAIDDHQTANAASLADAGAAWVLPQPTFTVTALRDHLAWLFAAPASLADAAARATTCGHAGAAALLADTIDEFLAQESAA
ncbi:MAG: UDP-N-acetylglucosamine--N-acetylmuramyl-(pentapeptide) pyrophosphoryl-undecaprenol N-acetylglucosamine transferase [Alphaproteobacteria bacterium]|nr:UDP-N-acetylglucosamine--N-acetylmuramyl-(pentapeptide) pyrophosphoryl-undecaprenol N-acetylglucosamine transferase [Alphaproteobacteria bacterium]